MRGANDIVEGRDRRKEGGCLSWLEDRKGRAFCLEKRKLLCSSSRYDPTFKASGASPSCSNSW